MNGPALKGFSVLFVLWKNRPKKKQNRKQHNIPSPLAILMYAGGYQKDHRWNKNLGIKKPGQTGARCD
jgi:hypothetical protein